MSDQQSMFLVEEDRQKWLKEVGPRHFSNMLDVIFTKQEEFGSRFIDFEHLTLEEKEKWTKEMVIAMIDELSEVLGHINFKHWKKRHDVNEIELKYELIDLFHFLIELMLIWGISAENLFSMYLAKMRENERRQKAGY